MMGQKRFFRQVLFGAFVVLSFTAIRGATATDGVLLAGSSTIYPLMQRVTAYMFEQGLLKIPQLESLGSGGGLQQFCGKRADGDIPMIAMASRPMSDKEKLQCAHNGITGITEILLGYDGIVLARGQNSAPLDVTQHQLFLALAAEVPAIEGEGWQPNPYTEWHQLGAALPTEPIVFIGPPGTSGTRDVLQEKLLNHHCPEGVQICGLRQDPTYITGGENDRLIIAGLHRHPAVVGIFGYNWLVRYHDQLVPVVIDDVLPSAESIAAGTYPLARPLFLYVRKQDVQNSLPARHFLQTLAQPAVWGEGGLLEKEGLVLPSDEAKQQVRQLLEKSL